VDLVRVGQPLHPGRARQDRQRRLDLRDHRRARHGHRRAERGRAGLARRCRDLLLRPEGTFDHDVILSFCHHVLFFSSAEAGEQWTAKRRDAFLLPLEQGFELGRRVFQEKFADALALERTA